MRVVFRVDASMRIGTGHVVRCMNLATVLRGRGADVAFLCRDQEGHMGAELARESFAVHMLPAPPRQPVDTCEDYSEWLGVPVSQDADETITAMGDGADWVVMDHYGLNASWQLALRACTQRVMAIEDLSGRRHECDLLLDQNALDGGGADHAERAPGARLLLGPRYALLRREYALRRASLAPDARREGLLVFFGGTDPFDLAGFALSALSSPETARLPVTFVLGPNYPFGDRLRAVAAGRPGTTVLGPQSHLAGLMAEAALAVGGGGITTWERMCLGLPAVVVSLAENQRPSCQALAGVGLIVYAGHFDEVTPRSFAKIVSQTVGDPQLMLKLALSGKHRVDGLGAIRVAEAMMPTGSAALALRRAQPSDAETYFDWVNDPAVRAAAFDSTPVHWATHEAWFARRVADPSALLFVMEAQGLPVGQVRFDVADGEGYIDYTLDPLVRGRGWAMHLLKAGMKAADGIARFRAEVKFGNAASVATFRKLGFHEVAGGDGRRIFTWTRGPIAA